VGDLGNHDTRPSLSPEGLLRALGVVKSGEGADWESRLRAGVVVASLAESMPAVAMPEGGYSDTEPIPAGFFATFEVAAGIRGCWVIPTQLIVGAVASIRIRRFDNKALAEAADPSEPATAVETPVYSINGFTASSRVIRSSVAGPAGPSLGVEWVVTNLLNLPEPWGKAGFWCPPASVIRFSHPTISTALTASLILREPLAQP